MLKKNLFRLCLILTQGLLAHGAEPSAPLLECHERGGLPNFFARLTTNAEVRIAYLGGSITAQDGWRPKSLRWFQSRFPQAKISEINAAIGGTGSDLGVFRLHQDVLAHHPSLLFIEFAVNDGGASPEQIHRCMEGIVRQTWLDNPATDICFVYTLAGNMLDSLKNGQPPRSYAAMEQVAAQYGIPTINMGLSVARLEKEGKLVFTGEKPKTDAEKAALGDKILFSPDAVHPYTDSGHQLYLEAIARAMESMQKTHAPASHSLGAPLVADHWVAAKLIPLGQAKLSSGWKKMDDAQSLKKNFGRQLPELWTASQPGETITFSFKGTCAKIYDLVGPDCGQVIVTLDDQKPVIKPRFDAYCTYHRLAYLEIGSNLSNTVHTVKLEIHPDQPDKAKILSQRNEKMDKPERFNSTAWYAGSIMLIGDLQ